MDDQQIRAQSRPKSNLDMRGSLLAKNTVLNFLGLAIPILVGVVTIPPTIHLLGNERFGILSLVWAVVGYFGVLDLGLSTAATKFVAESLGRGKENEVPGYLWTIVLFQTFLGLIGSVLMIVLTPLIAERILQIPVEFIQESKRTFYYLSFSLPVIYVSASFRGALEAKQKFDLVNAVKIPSSIINYVIPLVGVLLGMKLPGIVLTITISRAMTLFIWCLMCFRLFPGLLARVSIYTTIAKKILKFGSWIAVTNIINPFLMSLDRFFIGTIMNLESVTFYAAPLEVVLRLGIIPASLLITLFPMFSALQGRNEIDRSHYFFIRSFKYLILAMGGVVTLLFSLAQIIMRYWLGESFVQNSVLVFQILLIGLLMNALARIPYGYVQALGRTDITGRFHILELIFYIPLLFVLIKTWGIKGAALAWTIRVTADMILLIGASFKIGRLRPGDLYNQALKTTIWPLALFFILANLATKSFWTSFFIVPLGLFFVVGIWFYALTPDEKNWLKGKFLILTRKRL